MRDIFPLHSIPLKLHISPDFIGYIVSSDKVNSLLNELCERFIAQLTSIGINCEGLFKRRKTAYHMSVAYGFSTLQASALSELQQTCLPETLNDALSSWTLDLFSFDHRLSLADTELYEMQVTMEVNDELFMKLSRKKTTDSHSEIHTSVMPSSAQSPNTELSPDSSDSMLGTISSERYDNAAVNRINNPAVPNGCVSRSFSNRSSSLESHSYATNTCPHSHSQPTLPHQKHDLILLTGADDSSGCVGSAIGLNLSSGLTGVFNLSSGKRVGKSCAWVSHRSTLLAGVPDNGVRNEDTDMIFVAPSIVPASFVTHANLRDMLQSRSAVANTGLSKCPADTPATGTYTPSRNGSPASSPAASETTFSRLTLRGQQLLYKSGGAMKTKVDSSSSAPTLFSSMFGILGRRGSSTKDGNQRRLFVMRHAERVDLCFGRGWTTHCIDRRGLYRRWNLNLPPRLHNREDLVDHVLDSPLTQIGVFVAAASGKALAEAGVRFCACYASPALRCVQTACELLHASDQAHIAVRIEPLLFEWLGWYPGRLPNFLSPQTLQKLGYSVDVSYVPISSTEQFIPQETVSNYYERSEMLVNAILEQHKAKDSSILIVAHAASLDTCTRSLLRKRLHSGGSCSGGMNDVEDLHRRCVCVPYCGMLVAVEGKRWHLQEPPIPCLSYKENSDFDWRQFYGSSFYSLGLK
uniref:Ubiquitin-associated and SH3 domain-containing protein B n=1 Tax=Schistocephalus solidus TaxID=70667 RepID=A0A0V0JB18_SCHSO